MNGYGGKVNGNTFNPVLPGWDKFRGTVRGPNDNTFKFEDGSVRKFPQTGFGLHDKIVTDWAQDFIRASAPKDQPFAVVASLRSPHLPADYPDSYEDRFTQATLPRPPSFNEPNVSDKPQFLRYPKITPDQKSDLAAFNKKRLRSAAFADNQVSQLVSTLKDKREFGNTLFVFWNDNGYHMGQNRLPDVTHGGKRLPYLEDVRFPMLVSGPGIPAGVRSDEFISAVDLLPTFLDVAGAQVPDYADGRSFLPLARGEDVEWRDFAYSEMSDAAGTPKGNWRTVYTKEEAYHEWTTTGGKELYDLSRDPHELDNLLSPGDSAASLGTLAERMATCSGDACRRAENP